MNNDEKLQFIKDNYKYYRKFELLPESRKEIASEWLTHVLSVAPKRLYKYRVCNDDNLRILKERKAWFSSPRTWNDPIDVTVLYNLEKDFKELEDNFDNLVVKFAFSFINKHIESFCKQKKFVTADKVKEVYYSSFVGDSKFNPDRMINYLEPIVGWKLARQITVKTQKAFMQTFSPEFKEQVINSFKQFLGFNDLKDKVLMYSLSETYNNNHQRAIYADGGKGFCVGYLLKPKNITEESLFMNLTPIYYGEKKELSLPKLLNESLEYLDRLERITDVINQEMENLYVSLNIKSPEWNGEQEWRFSVVKEQVSSNKIDFDFAEAIYLGETIETEWKIKLIEIAKEQHLEVYQRKLDKLGATWIYEKLVI